MQGGIISDRAMVALQAVAGLTDAGHGLEPEHGLLYGDVDGDGFEPRPTQHVWNRLTGLERKLGRAPPSTRNNELFKIACLTAEMVDEGVLHPNHAMAVLINGCLENGLLRDSGRTQCVATIRSAFRTVEEKMARLKARGWSWPKASDY